MAANKLFSTITTTLLLVALSSCGDTQNGGASPKVTVAPLTRPMDSPDAKPEDLSAVECVIQGEQVLKDGDRAAALKYYEQAVKKTADNPPQQKEFAARKAEIEKAAK